MMNLKRLIRDFFRKYRQIIETIREKRIAIVDELIVKLNDDVRSFQEYVLDKSNRINFNVTLNELKKFQKFIKELSLPISKVKVSISSLNKLWDKVSELRDSRKKRIEKNIAEESVHIEQAENDIKSLISNKEKTKLSSESVYDRAVAIQKAVEKNVRSKSTKEELIKKINELKQPYEDSLSEMKKLNDKKNKDLESQLKNRSEKYELRIEELSESANKTDYTNELNTRLKQLTIDLKKDKYIKTAAKATFVEKLSQVEDLIKFKQVDSLLKTASDDQTPSSEKRSIVVELRNIKVYFTSRLTRLKEIIASTGFDILRKQELQSIHKTVKGYYNHTNTVLTNLVNKLD